MEGTVVKWDAFRDRISESNCHFRFLLQSLGDLDARLRSLGSRLLLLQARDDVAGAVCAALKDVSSDANLTGFLFVHRVRRPY
jgi:deoxyribodipyrimidine photolyase